MLHYIKYQNYIKGRTMERLSEIQAVRFVVFISGAIVMGVEIMASRLLAPYYGDTVYTWGSLIAVIMMALAIGYRKGGRNADRYVSYFEFSNLILKAGVFVVIIPVSAPFIMEFVGELGLPLMYEPLLPSAILLTIPTMYLGMVSPYALRLTAKNLDNLGDVSGGLSSLNTIGSIVGTFMTVFFLVPNFGTREIITSMGVFLVGVAMIRRKRSFVLAVALLMVLIIVPGNILLRRFVVFGSGANVYSTETPYSTLSVVDNKFAGTRTLYLNNLPHSAMYINGSVTPVHRYTDYFNLAFGYNPNISRVLFIGGGGFSGPKQFMVDYPDVNISVVEIDPVVVDVAHSYFLVPRTNPRLEIAVMDGRQFLEITGVYDLIVMDAYSYTYVPFHLMTDEFMQLASSHLTENGVLVANVIGSLIGDTSELLWSQVVTTKQRIPNVELFKTRDDPDGIVQNICLVATKQRVSQTKVRDNLFETADPRHVEFLDYLYDGEYRWDALVLYDNYAPVEDMLNPVTLTSYDAKGRLVVQNFLNPVFMAGIWFVSMSGLYYLTRKL
jgi:predicted membrane-bound spermidine synthase